MFSRDKSRIWQTRIETRTCRLETTALELLRQLLPGTRIAIHNTDNIVTETVRRTRHTSPVVTIGKNDQFHS